MISVLDLFSVGIGPSSSHTVGPMRAARAFAETLSATARFDEVDRVRVDLYGSLGSTGRGHGTDRAILLGLEGELPESVSTDGMQQRCDAILQRGIVMLGGRLPVSLTNDDVVFRGNERMPRHPNGMRFTAFDASGAQLCVSEAYSVGGGFVVGAEEAALRGGPRGDKVGTGTGPEPYPFNSAQQLLAHCARTGLPISTIMMANEAVRRSEQEVTDGLAMIWSVMRQCVESGLKADGTLPGGLKVSRRAGHMARRLSDEGRADDPLIQLDWATVFAMAVSEENACGGRVVTAPTNGAAGVVPAVLNYYMQFTKGASERDAVRFLLTAGAIAQLYKANASISGAEVGCQGEVGSACSMAAAALCEVLGGTPAQVENAAEIAMEHNLGLTCDPVGGLVQIPCIERNAMAAAQAITAVRIALNGSGKHIVSLDTVIETMRATGADMSDKYKETSTGGLAINVIEC
ncbi:L-serine ammonia-lyase [Nocardia sp. NPDC004123]